MPIASGTEIIIVDDVYRKEQIKDAKIFASQKMIGSELPFGTLSSEIQLGYHIGTLFVPKGSSSLITSNNEEFRVMPFIYISTGDPTKYKYGSKVLVKHNGKILGKYFMNDVIHTRDDRYRIECVSVLGLLTKSFHYGGIYEGILAKDLIQEIIGTGVPYTIKEELQNIPIYGWLPVASKRDNLHHVLFAIGGIAGHDANGDLFITFPSAASPVTIEENRIFRNGNSDLKKPVKAISISEHSFAKFNDSSKNIFQGEISSNRIISPKTGEFVTGDIVLFNSPMIASSLSASNTSIIERGVNYAILSPATLCTLRGTPYTHSIRQAIYYTTSSKLRTISEDENDTISVEDEYLISILNSEKVAQRLQSYYQDAIGINTDIVVKDEKPGLAVSFTSPDLKKLSGIIEDMDINISSTLKSSTKIISGYAPPSPGNFYSKSLQILYSRSWIVPDGVTKIRMVLIGGGTGGSSGRNGSRGSGALSPSGTGYGGSGGSGGSGGKIYVETIEVTPGTSINISIGKGGLGGIYSESSSNYGQSGKATTASINGKKISSDFGAFSSQGFLDILTGEKYAFRGESGTYGGDGRTPDRNYTITYLGVTYYSGENGTTYSDSGGIGQGGFGGGPAAGNNGKRGSDGNPQSGSRPGYLGGTGGFGADAVAPKKQLIRGNGGFGGNGGGGGGQGGYANGGEISTDGDGGPGGKGSDGGEGADGIVIIYY